MILPLLMAAASLAAPSAPASAAPTRVTARSIVERQLASPPRGPAPRMSDEEAARLRTQYLQRIGKRLELSDPASGAGQHGGSPP